MSRDSRAPDRDAELLTAYVDSVTELSPDERRQIEAQLADDPDARCEQVAVRAMLDRLRELPPEGTEPDWGALERSIRQAVGDEVPRPWWRRWRWIAPASALLTAAAVVLVLWPGPAPLDAPPGAQATRPVAEPALPRAPEARPHEDVIALWLDGAAVDVELSAAVALVEDAPGEDAPDEHAADDAELFNSDEDDMNLLPSTNLAWVDQLDDEAVDRAERWLARSKG